MDEGAGSPVGAPSAESWHGIGDSTDHSIVPGVQDAAADVEGKLNCPKCGSRVGVLKWTGNQCSCECDVGGCPRHSGSRRRRWL